MARARRTVLLTNGATEIAIWLEADRVVICESVAFGDKTRAEIQQNIILALLEESGAVRISGHNVGKEQADESGQGNEHGVPCRGNTLGDVKHT